MRILIHILLVLGMLGTGISVESVSAAQSDDALDLANVPLPIQDLPEQGYQVLAGDYLSPNDIVVQIAEPRQFVPSEVTDQVAAMGIARVYVLDLVLPEDRAFQDSPVLAVQQTAIYVLENQDDTDDLLALLSDYSQLAYVTDNDPAIDGATTVATIGEGGDILRTVVGDGRVVIEIVSMDATGAPDESEHITIVQGTIDRLASARTSDDGGLSSAALTLIPDENTAPFVHTQQSGVHGLYRLRDGVYQPAIGEMGTDSYQSVAGLESQYYSSDAARTGSGNAVVSIWLAGFDSESSASEYYNSIVAADPSGDMFDPFFIMDPGESWTGQGITGLYRVAGEFEGVRYSGNVEIRLEGSAIVVVGYRAVGASLPSIDITSALVDHQLSCMSSSEICPPFNLAAALPQEPATPAQATPVVDTSYLGSSEFGWSLPELGPEWTITEQYSEPGYDRIGLINGVSQFEFESVVNHHGDPLQCVLDEQHMLEIFEEHSVITVWEDQEGNTQGGSEDDHAWIVYRVEPLAEERADQEYVIRIDCFLLVSDSANLVMTQIAPVDVWPQEMPKGDFLRESLILTETIASRDRLEIAMHDRRIIMIYTHWVEKAA